MADAVYNHILVIEENNIAVLSHDLHGKYMCAQIAHLIAMFKPETQDSLQSGLFNGKNTGVLQMLAQQHTKGRCLQGCLPADPGQIDQGKRRVRGEIQPDLSASLFHCRTDRENQFIFVSLSDFIYPPSGDSILQFFAESGDGDSIKCHDKLCSCSIMILQHIIV